MAENPLARPPRVLVPELTDLLRSSEETLEISLKVEERDHVRSRRLRDGDEVVALDGKGARAAAQIARGGAAIALLPSKKISSSSSLCSSSSSSTPSPLPGEPANRVTILLACAEPARIEWAIEKGTECGAAGFVLLDAERSQRAHVAALAKRIPRLVRIAEEATKQCDRTLVPFVEGPKSTEDFLRRGRGEILLIADPAGAPLRVVPGGREAILAIGPEGGFSPSELLLFKESHSLLFSLGPRILRLETAVVVALARLVDPR
ncbi:MAG: RsmE family RNA methyltransferase [Acidobacteriota bacterium]